MPIYEYRCDACGHTVEVFQKFSDAPLESCEVCGGHVSKVLHPVAIHFKGSGFYTTDYGRGSGKGRSAGDSAKVADEARAAGAAKAAEAPAAKGGRRRRRRQESGKGRSGGGGDAAAPLLEQRQGRVGRPGGGSHAVARRRGRDRRLTLERFARQARANLRNLVSDDSLELPSLRLIADGIRLELEKRGEVAILYVGLKRYGRLERVFGWQITSDVLDACSASPGDGGHLAAQARRAGRLHAVRQRLHRRALAAAPRQGDLRDDLTAISRRVYERLQLMLLNDLAPGVFDRVHPFVTVRCCRPATTSPSSSRCKTAWRRPCRPPSASG